jgi:hypothetical protein
MRTDGLGRAIMNNHATLTAAPTRPMLRGVRNGAMPGSAARRPAQQRERRSHLLQRAISIGVAAALVIPSTVTIPIGSSNLTAMRVILVTLFVPAVVSLLKGVASGQRRTRLSDYFALLTVAWTMSALSLTAGFERTIVSGTLICLEAVGGYVIMRAFFADIDDIRYFVRCVAYAVLIMTGIAVIDHIMRQNFIGGVIASAFGSRVPASEFRNGFLRAASTLDHPIMFGALCAISGLIFAYGLQGARRLAFFGASAFGCLLAMSSAPILALLMGLGLMIYDRVLRGYPWRWRMMLFTIAFFAIALCIAKDDPVATIVRHLTLDPQTGFYRMMIWQYAGAEVLNSPWVGIGFRDWSRIPGMNGSVDTIWLVFALYAGIPMAVFYGIFLLTTMRRNSSKIKETLLNPYLVRLSRGLSIVLCLIVVVGFTVHFWGVMLTLIGMLAGLRTTLEEIRSRQVSALLRPVLRGSARHLPETLLSRNATQALNSRDRDFEKAQMFRAK